MLTRRDLFAEPPLLDKPLLDRARSIFFFSEAASSCDRQYTHPGSGEK